MGTLAVNSSRGKLPIKQMHLEAMLGYNSPSFIA
jgi:hypothetical protein